MIQLAYEGRLWVDASNFHVETQEQLTFHNRLKYKNDKEAESNVLKVPSFRIISYATLSDIKTPFLFHTQTRNWEVRFPILMKEILSYQADFYCLHDVDHFSDSWSPAFSVKGYDSIFKCKTQVKDLHDEGVLFAFNRNRFRLIKSVFLEFNESMQDDSKGSSFRDRCRTDDVGIVAIVQPIQRKGEVGCPLCIVSAMLSPAFADEDVRSTQIAYLIQNVEYLNREFHAPVVLGLNLSDRPASMSYTLLRTGREALSAQVPPKCRQPTSTPECRTSALIKWYPPKLTIADPTITCYRIAWRTGGSTALGFQDQVEVAAGDCIAYHEVMDKNRNKKVVAKEQLQYTVTQLCAEVTYEFRVCAVNSMGEGPWSDPTEPFVLPNPDKVSSMIDDYIY
jgi:hypothetical protein